MEVSKLETWIKLLHSTYLEDGHNEIMFRETQNIFQFAHIEMSNLEQLLNQRFINALYIGLTNAKHYRIIENIFRCLYLVSCTKNGNQIILEV